MRVEISYGKGQFWRSSGQLKSIRSLCCGVCTKKDYSVLHNGMTARLLQPTAMLTTGRCHITLSLMKNPPLRCGLSSKFFDHVFWLIQLYNNTLRNWASLSEKCKRRVRPILYVVNMTSAASKHNELLTSALHLDWAVLEAPRVSYIGLPFIEDMYFDAAGRYPNCLFYAYANGDILFDRGLTDTLLAVAEVKRLQLIAKKHRRFIFNVF